MEHQDKTRRTCTTTCAGCSESAFWQLTSRDITGPVDIMISRRPVIPIVFLPGIMGSNIFNTELKKPTWEPDKGFSTLQMYNTQIYASRRQQLLNKESTEVYTDGTIKAPDEEREEILKRRGWGSVMAKTYHPFLGHLQRWLNNVFYNGVLGLTWKEVMGLPLAKYGMHYNAAPLRMDELETLLKYRFEAWACGYNWLRSNEESAQKVQEFITQTVLPHYAEDEEKGKARLGTDKKVILITHSMGGLVARSMVAQGFDTNILGIIHIAMPANGAAEAYSNMRQGVQGFPLNTVLGSNARTLGAVYSQCLGGLELLPFGQSYNSPLAARTETPAWLKKPSQQGEWFFLYDVRNTPALGSVKDGTDIYDKVYTSPHWYGLLPDHNLRYFDPASILANSSNLEKNRNLFTTYIQNVKEFHRTIRRIYHQCTYAIWGESYNEPAIGEIVWVRSKNKEKRQNIFDDGVGKCGTIDGEYTLNTIHHIGDGTVPHASWQGDLHCIRGYSRLGVSDGTASHVSSGELHCENKPNSCKSEHTAPKGFSHQDACLSNETQKAALYFTVKIISENKDKLKSL